MITASCVDYSHIMSLNMSDIPIDCLDQRSTLLLCFITERVINSNNSCRPCLMSVVL